MSTLTTKHRLGLVTVVVDGENWVMVDIGLRMLVPRELANGQGFRRNYILTGPQWRQVAKIGNAVCPHVAKALVSANFQPQKRSATPRKRFRNYKKPARRL